MDAPNPIVRNLVILLLLSTAKMKKNTNKARKDVLMDVMTVAIIVRSAHPPIRIFKLFLSCRENRIVLTMEAKAMTKYMAV